MENDQADSGAGKRMRKILSVFLSGVIIVMVLLALVFVMLWRYMPAPEPEFFLTPDASGFAVLQVDPDNEELLGLMRNLMHDPPEGWGFSPEEQLIWRWTPQEALKHAEKLLPINAVLLLNRPEQSIDEDERHHVTARRFGNNLMLGYLERWQNHRPGESRLDTGIVLSTSRLGWVLRWLVRRGNAEIKSHDGLLERHGRGRIGTDKSGFSISAVQGSFMTADNPGIIRRWIETLNNGNPKGDSVFNGLAGLETLYERIDRRAPFYFAISNKNGELDLLVREIDERLEIDRDSDTGYFIAALGNVLRQMTNLGGFLCLSENGEIELSILGDCVNEDRAQEIGVMIVHILKGFDLLGDFILEGEADGKSVHIRIRHDSIMELLNGERGN